MMHNVIIIEQYDIVNKLHFFSRSNRKRGRVQHRHVQTAFVAVIFKTLGLIRLSLFLPYSNHESDKFQSFHAQTTFTARA